MFTFINSLHAVSLPLQRRPRTPLIIIISTVSLTLALAAIPTLETFPTHFPFSLEMSAMKSDEGAKKMSAADKGQLALNILSAVLIFFSSPYFFWLCFRAKRVFGASMFRALMCASAVLIW